jgi:hypothetical protein
MNRALHTHNPMECSNHHISGGKIGVTFTHIPTMKKINISKMSMTFTTGAKNSHQNKCFGLKDRQSHIAQLPSSS